MERSYPEKDEYLSIAKRLPVSMKNAFWTALCDAVQAEADLIHSSAEDIKRIYSIDDADDIDHLLAIAHTMFGYDRETLDNIVNSLYTRYSSYGFVDLTTYSIEVGSNSLPIYRKSTRYNESVAAVGEDVGVTAGESSMYNLGDVISYEDGDIFTSIIDPNTYEVSFTPEGTISHGSVRVLMTLTNSNGELETLLVAEDDGNGGFYQSCAGLLIEDGYILYDKTEIKIQFSTVIGTVKSVVFTYGVFESSSEDVNTLSEGGLYDTVKKEVAKASFFNLHRGSREFYTSIFSFFGFRFMNRIFSYIISSAITCYDNKLGRHYPLVRSSALNVDTLIQEPKKIEYSSVTYSHRLDTGETLDSGTGDRFIDISSDASFERVGRIVGLDSVVDKCSISPYTAEEYTSGNIFSYQSKLNTGYPFLSGDANLRFKTLALTDILSYMQYFIGFYKRSCDIIDLGFQCTSVCDESGYYDKESLIDRLSGAFYTDVDLLMRTEFTTAAEDVAAFNLYDNSPTYYQDETKRLHVVFGSGNRKMRSIHETSPEAFPTSCVCPVCDVDILPSDITVGKNKISLIARYEGKSILGTVYSYTDGSWTLPSQWEEFRNNIPIVEGSVLLRVTLDDGTYHILSDDGGGGLSSKDSLSTVILGNISYLTGDVNITSIYGSHTVTGIEVLRGYTSHDVGISEMMLYMGSKPIVYSVFPLVMFTSYLSMNLGLVISKE